jgi:hypothetical protein
MSESQEIIEIPAYEIGVIRAPKAILDEARIAAKALMEVVRQKPKPVIMNGEHYLEFEDWQTVAKFYGITAKVVKTTFIDLGGVKGFEATAEAIRLSDGMAISAADAMCLNDEDKWSTRTKYEYVDGNKVKVGDVPVPLFQLRSMAQTRAAAKCLRNVLAWVVVLAGFKPSVAEEMTGDEVPYENGGKPVVKQPEEIKFVDIITLAQGKVGDKLNIQAYVISLKHGQVGAKKSDITKYIVGDLPKDPTLQVEISAWGLPLETVAGNIIKFKEVVIGEYKGAKQYTANEAING